MSNSFINNCLDLSFKHMIDWMQYLKIDTITNKKRIPSGWFGSIFHYALIYKQAANLKPMNPWLTSISLGLELAAWSDAACALSQAKRGCSQDTYSNWQPPYHMMMLGLCVDMSCLCSMMQKTSRFLACVNITWASKNADKIFISLQIDTSKLDRAWFTTFDSLFCTLLWPYTEIVLKSYKMHTAELQMQSPQHIWWL